MWPFTSSSPYDGLFRTIDEVATPAVHSSSLAAGAKGIPEYDYIIVGGGTAGCVLARRLSENPNISVLLLERGDVSSSWFSNIPLFSIVPLYDKSIIPYADKWFGTWEAGSIYDKSMDYNKLTLAPSSNPPEPVTTPLATTRTSREIPLLAGKALGGTTKINSQLYTRPFAGELNSWAASCGDPSWEYENMKELMKRSENNIAASTSEEEYRGRNGPWLTQKFGKILFQSCKSAIKACEAIGIPLVPQCNHPSGPAVGIFDIERTMTEGGKRITTFDGFLPPDVVRERRSRLTICPGVVVSSVDVRGDKDNLSARGVFLEPAAGKKAKAKKYYVAAKREVILCSGVVVSPQILMLSGIGPKKHLEQMGIPVVRDHPGVGSHLQDHCPVSLVYSVPIEDSLVVLQKKPLRLLKEAFNYFFFKTGLFVFPCPQLLLFMRSALLHDPKQGGSHGIGSIEYQADAVSSQLDTRIPENVPDIELQCLQVPATLFPLTIPKHRGGYSFFCLGLQPHSLGSITLSSRNPHERPKCTLGLYSHPDDLIVMRKAVRLAIKIGKTMKEQGYDIEPLWIPRSETEEDLDEFILCEPRANYHLSSTCRMAPEFPALNWDSNENNVNAAGVGKTPGVVDSQLRVYGIKGLRIADASIFPTVPACHLQAPVVLVAEKCAEIIKATWV